MGRTLEARRDRRDDPELNAVAGKRSSRSGRLTSRVTRTAPIGSLGHRQKRAGGLKALSITASSSVDRGLGSALVRSEPSPIVDRSLHNVVYSSILQALHEGDLRPGDRLIEDKIAKTLGMSRLPVREALTRLANEGLVRRIPRRGTVIAERSAKDLEDIRAIRALLEGYAARIASQRVTGGDLHALRHSVEELTRAGRRGDWVGAVQWNTVFHETTIRLAGNSLLHRIWSSVNPMFWNLAVALPSQYRRDPVKDRVDHEALIAALQSGDVDRAENAFREHVHASTKGDSPAGKSKSQPGKSRG